MHDSGEMHRRIAEAVPEGIWLVCTEGRTIFCNDRMAEILGTDVESLHRMSCFDPVFPADLAEARLQFGIQMTGKGRPFDFRLRRVDGSAVWVSISCSPMRDIGGASTGLLGLFTDISERRQAQAALQESEERFRNMADTAPVMIWVAGPDKGCTYFNKCCLNFTGRSMDQKLGDGWTEAVHPEDREQFLARYSSSCDARQEFQAVFRLRRADREYRQVLTTGVPRFTADGVFVGYIGSCVDVTELRRMQEQALASQKLESIGVLAGGIAHDFNNLLAGILAEAELVTAELETSRSLLPGLQRIRLSALRGAEIVRQLMIYAGKENAEPIEPIDVPKLVEEMLVLLKVSVSKHTVLKIDLRQNLPDVLGRASQIRQIVMNLVVNASEAIGDESGVISVTALGHPNCPPSLPAGNFLKLEVSDTGQGMTEEVQAKVFDPFFSTKFPGRGLGLAVVQGIVRDHGGAINLVSSPGQGTKFEIFLPCVGGSTKSGRAGRRASRVEHPPAFGTVLVVEDEELLRTAVSRMLRSKGFGVIEAGDGRSALELIGAPGNHIDLMLLDASLPGVSSREVLKQALGTRPNLKVIFTSAYSRETVDGVFAGMRIERFIRKPFQFVDLMSLLQDAASK